MTTEIQQPPAPPAATDAQIQMNALTADPAWVDRFLSGNASALNEFHTLSGAIVDGGSADDVVTSVLAGKAPELGNTVQKQMAATVDHFRGLAIDDGVTKQFLSGEKVSPHEYQLVCNLKRELMGDAEFVRAYLAGDVKANKRMTIINSVIVNGVKVEKAE